MIKFNPGIDVVESPVPCGLTFPDKGLMILLSSPDQVLLPVLIPGVITMDKSCYKRIRVLVIFLWLYSCLCLAGERNDEPLVAVGGPVSLSDIDTSRPVGYSRRRDDVIISLVYRSTFPVEISIFGNGDVRGETTRAVSVVSKNGVFRQVNVKHVFTTHLSEDEMEGMLKSMAGLLNFDLALVKTELAESKDCWVYCPDVIVSDAPGTTAELRINVLNYTLYSGEVIKNIKKTIGWDKTDLLEAAKKFPHVYKLQVLGREVSKLLAFCMYQ